MARARLFDVPCNERRRPGRRRALRVDYESQFRRPAGTRRKNALDESGDGRRRCHYRLHHRRTEDGRHAMSTYTHIEGSLMPLPVENLDTDQIMPKQFLRIVDKAGLADGLLYDLRYDGAGKPRPGAILNDSRYRQAKVLVGGA